MTCLHGKMVHFFKRLVIPRDETPIYKVTYLHGDVEQK
ncbi:hypothetical protein BMG_3650 [Priestia megaterium]|nr:hypothetical protein BMG_3650 [Priestia megaterium]